MVFRKTKKKQRKKKRKKENGAHKHRSHLKKLSAQNIHVMLSYAKKAKLTHVLTKIWGNVTFAPIFRLHATL